MKMRPIARVVDGKDNGVMHRIIGSLDCVGQGTLHEELPHVNPFVLLDNVRPMRKRGVPPFGLHPHAGLQVLTIIWDGVVSNRMGGRHAPAIVGAPGKLSAAMISAGRGCCHDEHTADDNVCEMSQLAWLVPAQFREEASFFVDLTPTARLSDDGKVVTYQLIGDEQPSMRVFSPIQVIVGTIEPSGHTTLAVPPEHNGGNGGCGVFVFARSGSLEINEGAALLTDNQIAVFEERSEGQSSCAKLTNRGDTPAQFLFACGRIVGDPWVKYLTNNGFVICRDLEAAKEKEALYEKHGESFGNLPN